MAYNSNTPDVTDEFLQSIFSSSFWPQDVKSEVAKVNESKNPEPKDKPKSKPKQKVEESVEEPKQEEAVEDSTEEVTEEQIQEALALGKIHQCPLCESLLEDPISDERIAEHTNQILDVINEASQSEGEPLSEESEVEEKTDEE